MKKLTLRSIAGLSVLSILLLGACGKNQSQSQTGTPDDSTAEDTENNAPDTSLPAAYEQISQAKAKELMDSEDGYVLIDARTEAEFAQGHIAGAILIPEYEIADRAEGELPDKNALILVYCRSGRRSKIAAKALAELGYTNVKEFGGIISWEYGVVK